LVRAADNNAVWLTAANPIGNFEQVAGVLRFDGQTWTHYLADTDVTDTVDDIAVAPDGTIWYTQNNSLYQLEP
jgi:streptogramin lyase